MRAQHFGGKRLRNQSHGARYRAACHRRLALSGSRWPNRRRALRAPEFPLPACFCQMLQRGRIGFPREWTVAAQLRRGDRRAAPIPGRRESPAWPEGWLVAPPAMGWRPLSAWSVSTMPASKNWLACATASRSSCSERCRLSASSGRSTPLASQRARHQGRCQPSPTIDANPIFRKLPARRTSSSRRVGGVGDLSAAESDEGAASEIEDDSRTLAAYVGERCRQSPTS